MEIILTGVTLPTFKEKYLRLIASGQSESRALEALRGEGYVCDWLDFYELLAKDQAFKKKIDDARKGRAEVWVGKIADAVTSDIPIPAERVPAEKLRFEQLKFLAKADNPERYGDAGGSKVNMSINFNDLQLLSPTDAMKALNNDPFNKMVTIETESKTLEAEDGTREEENR